MTDPITTTISAALVIARQRHGGSRDEIAAAARAAGAPVKMTASALRNLESGVRCPSVEELCWLADALAVPVWRLLGDHAAMFSPDDVAPPTGGPVEVATRAAIGGLGDLSGRQKALAAIAYTLAQELDGVGEKRQPPALAKTLTDTIAALWDLNPLGDEEDDDLGAE